LNSPLKVRLQANITVAQMTGRVHMKSQGEVGLELFLLLVVDPCDAQIFFHMLKVIVHLNNSSSFLGIY
jgi:hypothetical protein